jgi:hypothetical protein
MTVVLWFMAFNATFNNISVISWLSVLLVEETRVSGENHRPVVRHRQTLSHSIVYIEHTYFKNMRDYPALHLDVN